MSEERTQISMSNTKKEMLEAYQALLAEVQTKSLENPREEQKRIEQKKIVAQAEALLAETYGAPLLCTLPGPPCAPECHLPKLTLCFAIPSLLYLLVDVMVSLQHMAKPKVAL